MRTYQVAVPLGALALGILGFVACSSDDSSNNTPEGGTSSSSGSSSGSSSSSSSSSSSGGSSSSSSSSSSSGGSSSSSSSSSSSGGGADGGDGGTPDAAANDAAAEGGAVTFSGDIYTIFKTDCVGCHAPGVHYGQDAAAGPAGNLDLSGGGYFMGGLDGGTADGSWNNIVNKPAPAGVPCATANDGGPYVLIVPDDAGASLLCNKVASKVNDVLPLCGNPMPFSPPFLSTLDAGLLDSGAYSGFTLTPAQLTTLRAWINEGAPNN